MTAAQRVVIILLVLSILAGALTGDQLYYRLSILWGILLGGAWLFSYTSLRGIQINRKARFLRSQVGLVFEERYVIRNPGRLPRLWIEIQDGSSLPGIVNSFVISIINSEENRTFTSRTRLNKRGIFQLGPTILTSGDPFGLFPITRICPNDDSLLVYPMMVDILDFPNPPGLLPGGDSLRRRTQQITSNASGVREYAPGDPLNRIHWLSTARRNRLMAKEFELDPLAEVWIFVDSFSQIHYHLPEGDDEEEIEVGWQDQSRYTLPPSSIEYSVSIAASLARYYLQRDRAVGAVFSRSEVEILPSDRGGRQLNKILEALAMQQPDSTLPIEGLVEGHARHLPRGSTIILITPSTDDIIFNIGDVLLRRGLRPVIVLINGASFGGPDDPTILRNSLEILDIPVCVVSCGDDLSEILTTQVNTSRFREIVGV